MENDKYCPVSLKNFSVHVDGKDIYSCALNIADVINNSNKSYVMQLLQRKNETHLIYTRSGRVGQTGTMNTDIFMDKELATKEFMRVFHDKTGVKWPDRYTDTTVHTGKYQYILMKHDTPEHKKEAIKMNVVTLSDQVSLFVKHIHDPKLYKGAAQKFSLDTKKLPLGSLGLSQIEKASNIIAQINKYLDDEGIKKGKEQKVNDLSSLFYTTIPSVLTKLKPINTHDDLSHKADLLELLRNMCYVSKSANMDIMNQYWALDTELTHVTAGKTYDMINSYLNCNVGKTHKFHLSITDIYEINKPKERQAYRKWDSLHNKQLLWHGTSMANVTGILTTGLRINPTGIATTGKMFGNGLYFANSSTKSAAYMRIDTNSSGIMFLCEVALGNMLELTVANSNLKLPIGKHSTRGCGNMVPDTSSHIVIDDDVILPIGKMHTPTAIPSALLYDEFIVYDTTQIKMKYAVVVKYTSGGW